MLGGLVPENPMVDSALVALFKQAIPHWRSIPADCSVTRSIDGQNDYEDSITVVDQAGALADLAKRLGRTHPPNRTHHVEWDDRLWDVFAEAEAFAWADRIGQIGRPEFTDNHGKPDLWVPAANSWVEAKMINESDDEKAASRSLGASGSRGPFQVDPPASGIHEQD